MKGKNIGSQDWLAISSLSELFSVGLKCILLFGAFIFISYFIFINFIPIGDFKSVTYIIFLVTVLGLMSIFFIIFSFIFAPLAWLDLFQMHDSSALIVGAKNVSYFKKNYSSGHIDIPLNLRKWILLSYVGGVFLYISLVWLTGLFGLQKMNGGLIFFGILSLVLPRLFLGSTKIEKKIKNRFFSKKNKRGRKNFLRIIGIFKIFVFSSSSGVILLAGNILILGSLYYQTEQADKSTWFLFLISFLIVLSSGMCLIPDKSWNIKRWMFTVGSGTTIFIFLILGLFGTSAGTVLRIFKIGALPNASIIVDDIGCNILSQYGYPINCAPKGVHLIKDIEILWRIGEYYIQFQGRDNTKIRAVLTGHVLSLSVQEKADENDKLHHK